MTPQDLSKLDAGMRLAGYALSVPHTLVGRGTFGCVYRATTCNVDADDTPLAVKFIHSAVRDRHLWHLEMMQAQFHSADNLGVVPILHVGIVPGVEAVYTVMPFIPSEAPSDTIRKATLEDARAYMLGLLQGLSTCERAGLVHRDVKPRNVLWDAETRRAYLTDFGLIDLATDIRARARSSEEKSAPEIAKRRAQACAAQVVPPFSSSARQTGESVFLNAAQWLRDRTFGSVSSDYAELLGVGKTVSIDEAAGLVAPPTVTATSTRDVRGGTGEQRGAKRAREADKAGTAGFRAPEVLLGHAYQTSAVDVWSAGVILLCFLTRRYPLFPGRDDMEHLLMISQLWVGPHLREAAARMGRHLLLLPSDPGLVCTPLPRSPIEAMLNLIPTDRLREPGLPDAVELCLRLMHPDPDMRITATAAIEWHPWFNRHITPTRWRDFAPYWSQAVELAREDKQRMEEDHRAFQAKILAEEAAEAFAGDVSAVVVADGMQRVGIVPGSLRLDVGSTTAVAAVTLPVSPPYGAVAASEDAGSAGDADVAGDTPPTEQEEGGREDVGATVDAKSLVTESDLLAQ